MWNFHSRNPTAVRQRNTIDNSTHNVKQNERRVPWFTAWREAADVTYLVTDQRHRVGLKFRNQNWRFRLRQFRFDKIVRPVECVVKRMGWIQLNADTSCVARTISFVNGAAKSFFNQTSVSGPELLSSSNGTAGRIIWFVIPGEYVFSKIKALA